MSGGIDGLDAILAKLNNMEEDMLAEIKKSVGQSLKTIQAEAKMLVPVDDGVTRNTIQTRQWVDQYGIEGDVFTNAPWAPYIEFGTGLPGLRGETIGGPRYPEADGYAYTTTSWVYYSDKLGRFVTTEGQPARPFMYPAALNNRKKVKADIETAVRKAVGGK